MSDPVPPRPDLPRLAGGNGQVSAPPTDDLAAPVPWRGWEALAVFVLAVVGGALLGLLLVLPAEDQPENLRVALLSLGFQVGLALTVVAWVRGIHRTPLSALRFNSRRPGELGMGAAFGLAIYVGGAIGIGSLLVLLLNALTGETVEAPEQVPTDVSGAAVALTVVLVLVGAPVAEELFFRGFLFRALRRRGFLRAAIVSSVAFGLVHYDPASPWHDSLLLTLVMVPVGFGFATVFERYRNLLASMAAHAAFNSIGVIVILNS
ncbi:MAG: CPBP family intramembrane metalloprotease [Actinobacteria bacterium]|nr:CPBP family intramembrane metalloprotease [Actinomycetota bacterium]